jgi:DNA polymerase-3 subunit alpha
VAFQEVNLITKDMDEQLQWEWGDIFKYALQSKLVYKFVQDYPELINTLGFGLNQATNNTVHASAVIIVPKFDHEGNPMTIYDWLPVKKMQGQDGETIIVSQWEGKYTDRGGYLKEDILGLDQLDKFKRILYIIKNQMGQDVILEDIPLEDREIYKAFGKGWVEDVFQFGSDGLRSYCIRTKPKNIEHIIAMNALYRPGPMSSNAHTDFADILNRKKEPSYDYMLEDITAPTLGLYVYQEQIMKAVVVLGGLSLVESDNFRTAIKKFDKPKMAVYEEKFIQGAIERGCDPTEAKGIWTKQVSLCRLFHNGVLEYVAQDPLSSSVLGCIPSIQQGYANSL